ncbi:MAG TPA: carboxypeptidase-like regulatory domain-containing protein [Candidatus Eisenbacteria bacterium]|nr:carboxypeptidase-like regulatory domain-containing protein [Candidatus Eisenbacteria bacterium]
MAITIEGRITGPTGAPIAGASVHFYPRSDALSPEFADFTHTDSMGQYTAHILTGIYEIRVAPGIDGLLEHAERVTFTRLSRRYDYRFGGHLVRGSIRDPLGNTLDSGHVSASLKYGLYQTAGTRFHGGEYSLLLPSGTYVLRGASLERYSGLPVTETGAFSIRSDTTIHIDLGGHLVEGTVFDPDGAPMNDVLIEAYARTRFLSARTMADGRYRLWVHPDTYWFEFAPDDRNFSYIAPRVVGPLQVTAPRTLDQSLAGLEWTGTVSWRSTGAPVADVFVGVWSDTRPGSSRAATVRTDPQGAFRFVVQPELTYSLATLYDGAASVRLDGLVSRTDTTFSILLDQAPWP